MIKQSSGVVGALVQSVEFTSWPINLPELPTKDLLMVNFKVDHSTQKLIKRGQLSNSCPEVRHSLKTEPRVGVPVSFALPNRYLGYVLVTLENILLSNSGASAANVVTTASAGVVHILSTNYRFYRFFVKRIML